METSYLLKKTGLTERIINDIQKIAVQYHIAKIVLFGSRARGTHQPKSDIDLAIYDCADFTNFVYDMEEQVWTLLKFDLIDMNQEFISQELKAEIKKDGIIIYEKIR